MNAPVPNDFLHFPGKNSPKDSRVDPLNLTHPARLSSDRWHSPALPSPLPSDGRGEGQGEVRVRRVHGEKCLFHSNPTNAKVGKTLKIPNLLGMLALLVSGCAHYPVNARLTAVNPNTGYRFESVATRTNSDDLLMVLAFSGGGTRAAALSYGVLEELAKTEVGPPGNEHRLLDDVKVVSAVSGGSFTAAYYALYGDRVFSDYESRFLKKHVQTGLLLRVLAPWNLPRLASPKYGTSDLAAGYYDHLLFKGATFADLAPRPGRPFLIVNATDLGIGSRFEFTQDQFDLLQSDLSKFPIARAVAASAAFPPYFAPIVLKNYSAENPAPEPEYIESILSNPTASSRLKNLALEERSYIDGDRRKYIHLVDGGITDNLGLRGPVEEAIQLEEPGVAPQVPVKIPRRLAFIIVDASAERDYGWDSRERTLGMRTLMSSVAQVTGNRYSFETIELFREVSARLDREREAARVPAGNSPSTQIESYIVELHFNQTANEADRRFFNSVPTSLQLPASTVDRLEQLAGTELNNSPEFRRLVEDLRHPNAAPAVNLAGKDETP